MWDVVLLVFWATGFILLMGSWTLLDNSTGCTWKHAVGLFLLICLWPLTIPAVFTYAAVTRKQRVVASDAVRQRDAATSCSYCTFKGVKTRTPEELRAAKDEIKERLKAAGVSIVESGEMASGNIQKAKEV